MGGFGSGRKPSGSRGTTSSVPQLNINEFRKHDALSEGRYGVIEITVNNVNSTFYFRTGESEVTLAYSVDVCGQSIERHSYSVSVQWTHCNYGGVRPWFVCLGCAKRCQILYVGKENRIFQCRKCQNLCYRSQLEGVCERAINRIYFYRSKLKMNGTLIDRFPLVRPRYMHESTYLKILINLLRESESLQRHWLGLNGGRFRSSNGQYQHIL
jgi:hypothetical protein